MSQFEFVLTGMSIILGLGVSRVLEGLVSCLRHDEMYLIHVGWLVQKLGNLVMWWWAIWAFKSISWNFATFVLLLAGPLVLYVQVWALVSRPAGTVPSWRDHFYAIRPWFFAGNLALIALILVARIWVAPSETATLTPLPALILLGALAVLGIVASNPRVHAVIVLVAILTQYVGIGAAMFEVRS